MVKRGLERGMRIVWQRRQARRATEAPPLFVIGSGRSGNTLVRRVLMASEAIYIPPETYVLGEIIDIWPRTALLPWRERVWLFCAYFEKHPEFHTFGFDSLGTFAAQAATMPLPDRSLVALIDAFYMYLARSAGVAAPRWGDKTPYNTMYLASIGRLYPTAKYLWLLRDGRDVALSYVAAGLYPDLHAAGERWSAANRACMSFNAGGRDVRLQRYEDLVTDPETTFAEIFDWAGLPFAPDMLTRVPDRMGDVERLSHHDNVRAPISAASAGRWREQCTDKDLHALSPSFWAVMQELGYLADT